MEAQLAADPTLDVHRRRGALGELRVVVDGTEVVDTPALLYPKPMSVVSKVRAYLATAAGDQQSTGTTSGQS